MFRSKEEEKKKGGEDKKKPRRSNCEINSLPSLQTNSIKWVTIFSGERENRVWDSWWRRSGAGRCHRQYLKVATGISSCMVMSGRSLLTMAIWGQLLGRKMELVVLDKYPVIPLVFSKLMRLRGYFCSPKQLLRGHFSAPKWVFNLRKPPLLSTLHQDLYPRHQYNVVYPLSLCTEIPNSDEDSWSWQWHWWFWVQPLGHYPSTLPVHSTAVHPEKVSYTPHYTPRYSYHKPNRNFQTNHD